MMKTLLFFIIASIFFLPQSVELAAGREDENEVGHLIFIRSTSGRMPIVSIRFLQDGDNDGIDNDERQLFILDFVGRGNDAWGDWLRGGKGGPELDRFDWTISTASKGTLTEKQVEMLIKPIVLTLSDTVISTTNLRMYMHQGPAHVLMAPVGGEGRPLHYGSFRLLNGIGQFPLRPAEFARRGITEYVYSKYEDAYLRLQDGLNSAEQQMHMSDTEAMGLSLYLFRQTDSVPIVKGIRSRVVKGKLMVHDADAGKANADFKREASRQFLSKLTDPDGKITICHIPPGHADNDDDGARRHGRTIRIDVADIYDHLEHGDMAGVCPSRFDDDRGRGRKEKEKGHDRHRGKGDGEGGGKRK